MGLDQEGAEETVGNELKGKARESDLQSDICNISRHKTASAGLSKGEFHGHPLYTRTPLRGLVRTCIKKVEMSLMTNIFATFWGFTFECSAPMWEMRRP